MSTNIEFKAKIRDYHAASATAMALSGTCPRIITQEDVFFRCQYGRLKLRIFGDGQGELIHYQRDDLSGPKRSNYCVLPTATPHALHRVLADALGETVIVRKTRTLYLIDSTRIHLDMVEQLGEFIEVEVVLGDGVDVEQGEQIAADLLRQFGIRESDLVSTSYADLLAADLDSRSKLS